MATIHKAKDSSLRNILKEPELFIEFLRDFVPVDLLKNVEPADVEDISGQFLPLFSDSRESDTVKRIRLKGDMPLFVIAITEHESEVNYRASFKLLQYTTLVLTDYEKEANKGKKQTSGLKGFKYPPVLPIVFYDGPGKWTAETNFLNKTEMSEIFYKYIPKFEYELIVLNQYSEADLVRFGDILSLIMLVDKIKTPEKLSLLSELPADYVKQLETLNIPEHLKKLIADVITVLLERINIPKDEIAQVAEKVYERRFQEMFTMIKPYDVQETRRLERERTQKEMQEAMRAKEMEAQAEREKARAKEREAVRKLRQKHMTDEDIADVLSIPIEAVRNEFKHIQP